MNYLDPYAVASIIILVVMLISFFRQPFHKIVFAIRHLFVWVVIGFALLLVYTFSDTAKSIAQRSMFELNPGAAKLVNGTLEYRRAIDGHFHIDALVNDNSVSFMVDTGATDVILTMSDAQKAGINVSNLDFNRVYNTANGKVKAAVVKVDIQIEDNIFHDFEVSVNSGELRTSLLGMSLLSQFKSIKLNDNTLTIYVQ